MPYAQLTIGERERIAMMHANGHSQASIAAGLSRSPSTISRELLRNHGSLRQPPLGCMNVYIGGEANRLATARRQAANAARRRLDGDGSTDASGGRLGTYVQTKLTDYWSPQQIAGRLKVDHPSDPAMRLSPEAIYQWVYRQAADGATWHHQLRRAHRRRRRRIPLRNRQKSPQFKNAVRIDHRPPIVLQRSRIGDWESDTVIGGRGRPGTSASGRTSKAVLATHVDRCTRFVLIRKLKDNRAATFTRQSIRALETVPPEYRLTLTADNGSEFARFGTMEKKLGLKVFFAHPYSAWERPTNENTNGLIRQFFPKGFNLDGVTDERVAQVQQLINNRPRKCLNYRTPAELFIPPPGVALRN